MSLGWLDAARRSWLNERLLPAPEFPTPVRLYPEFGNARAKLWVKNDGLSHPVYGGNKVRKVERLVQAALDRGARRVVSVGAAGSHHLLTLTLLARAAGLSSVAVVFPQPRTPHAALTFCAALGQGLQVHPVRHASLVPWQLARIIGRGDYFVGPGGSNAIGSSACADAIDELAEQVESGELPMPDLIVVALGSGGTCAGLAAGLVRRGAPGQVLGVQVIAGPGPRLAARFLARRLLRGRARDLETRLQSQLRFDATEVGPGYGMASEAGEHALGVAQSAGLELDQTYTAKAFAAVLRALDRAPASSGPSSRPLRVLYWHTLSARPLAPLLDGAPSEAELPKTLSRLLV